MKHQLAWHSPAPLWPSDLGGAEAKERFHRPEILRFASDAFMEEIQNELTANPARLADRVLRAETWRDDDAFADLPSARAGEVVKLYQPTHGRFYLAAGSLVCKVRGLPDRRPDLAAGETISFVLRRRQSNREYAWCGTDSGWVEASTLTSLVDGEERLKTFPLAFTQELRYAGRTKRQPRRLHLGLIPVSSVETYLAGDLSLVPESDEVTLPDGDPDPLQDPRFSTYEAVMEGLRALAAANPADLEESVAREVFALGVLDLRVFFREQLPDVHEAIERGDGSGLDGAEASLFDDVLDEDFSNGVTVPTWLNLLQAITEEAEQQLFDGALGGTVFEELAHEQMALAVNSFTTDADAEVRSALGTFTGAYSASGEPTAEPNESPKLTYDDVDSEVSYVIRFVYERPQCRKKFEELVASNALPALRAILDAHERYRPLVSEASQPFKLASFFDPDAPQRPIRITMPVDTSVSGLRKFPRNVSFLLSDKLREQMQRVGKELDDIGKGDASQFNIGVICSFSIPIITIVALILLILFVVILNIIFWWLPFFRICFPIGITAKKS